MRKCVLCLFVIGWLARFATICLAQDDSRQEAPKRDLSTVIFKGEVVIAPEKAYQVPFDLSGRARNAILWIKITARGGSGNDIQVLVRRDNEVVYDSGQRSFLNEVISLGAAGRYYFVLNNDFSVFSQKRVAGFAVLMYDEPQRR